MLEDELERRRMDTENKIGGEEREPLTSSPHGSVQYDEYGFSISDRVPPVQAEVKAYHKWDKYIEELVDTGHITRTRQLKLLVREGIPGTFRGRIWSCLAGTDELRQLYPPRHYEHVLLRAENDPEMQTQVNSDIDKDLQRTFPGHRMFTTPDGLAALRRVLVAYSVHCPAVGYCQSLNFVVAMLLLFVNEEEAFWLLDTILHKLLTDNYYTSDMSGCLSDQECLRHLLAERLSDDLRRGSLLETDWEVPFFTHLLCLQSLALHLRQLRFNSALREP